MSTRSATLRPARRRPARARVGAVAAAVVLPFALVACGGDDEPSSDPSTPTNGGGSTAEGDPVASVKGGFDALLDSKAASFEFALEDNNGNLKKNIGTDADAAKVADIVIGGKIRLSIDPAGDATLRDVSTFKPGADFAESLKASNFGLAVEADGSDVVQLRFVEGVLYANADLDKVDEIAKQAGEDGVGTAITQFGSGSSPFAAVVKDAQAGKWLKLDVAPFASQLEGLAGSLAPSASASAAAVDGSKLVEDLVNAVLPATTATGEDGTYDIEIKAKEALTNAAAVLKRSGFPGLDSIDTSDIATIPDTGALKGQVTLDGDALKEVKIDLESINTIVDPSDKTKTPLTGSFVTMTVNSSADEITVPDDVSSVDLNALIQQFFGSFLSGFGGASSGSTPS